MNSWPSIRYESQRGPSRKIVRRSQHLAALAARRLSDDRTQLSDHIVPNDAIFIHITTHSCRPRTSG